MPDYGFYTDVYAGTVIKQAAFEEMIRRVAQWLEGLERCCRVQPYGPQSRQMALCAVAEVFHVFCFGNVKNQGVVLGTTLGFENFCNSGFVQSVSAQAVYSFGRNCYQTAVFQNFCRSGCGVGICSG